MNFKTNTVLIIAAVFITTSVFIAYYILTRLQSRVKRLREDTVLTLQEKSELLNKSDKIIDKAIQEIEYLRSIIDKTNQEYVILDMPVALKSVFYDVLKGFEEYAHLKGYTIALSIDSSVTDKVAFKFTIGENSGDITNSNVKDDIEAYMNRLRNGDSFDNMPYILSQQEHELVLTHLKNRISLLHHNYTLEKNAKEYYQKMLDQFSQGKGISSTPSIFIQTGGNHTPHNVHAVNSKAIGENITFEDVSDNSTKITISNSFNTKREQISKIDEVVKQLRELNDNSFETRQDIITGFSMIKDEICHAESPDKSKVYRWLSDIKSKAETLVFGHELSQAIQWIFDSFKFVG